MGDSLSRSERMASRRPDALVEAGRGRYAGATLVLRIAVEAIDAGVPSAAAERATQPSFGWLAPARTLLVAIAGRGIGPGIGVAPWILDGIRRAAAAEGLTAVAIDLTPKSTRGRVPLGGLAEETAAMGPITLDVPGGRRPRRIPRAWFGRHLCLVVPCTFLRRSSLTQGERWLGPAACGWAALDEACGGEGSTEGPAPLSSRIRVASPADPARVGARLASQIFASTSLVVDASWCAAVRPGDDAAPELVAVDRCLVASSSSPSERWTHATAAEVDAWIARKLRLDLGWTSREETVLAYGSGEAGWPRATVSKPAGLAEQAMEALWAAGRRRRPRGGVELRLPPSVPGPLARRWNDYAALMPRGPT